MLLLGAWGTGRAPTGASINGGGGAIGGSTGGVTSGPRPPTRDTRTWSGAPGAGAGVRTSTGPSSGAGTMIICDGRPGPGGGTRRVALKNHLGTPDFATHRVPDLLVPRREGERRVRHDDRGG